MRIDIHDVGHGHCSVITCPNGARVLVDCGYGASLGWRPSDAYAGTHFALATFTNLDEDHLDDLPRAPGRIGAQALFSNPTVTADALASMKPHGMKPGVRFMHSLLSQHGPGMIGPSPDLGGVAIRAYWNVFQRDFTDTNNLSLALFVKWGSFTILFAGDLETAGWRSLLGIPGFAEDLQTVRVLVASHHGRANGRCEDAFRWMRPDVVVFSDDARQYESQETDAWYRARVHGIRDLDNPRPFGAYGKRHVFTTRRDGHLMLTVDQASRYVVSPERISIRTPLLGPLGMLGIPAPSQPLRWPALR